MKNAKAIIIGGSSSAAYGEEKFHVALRDFISQTNKKFPKTKWLGICFGQQILAAALGGKASKLKCPPIYKTEPVSISKSFYSLPYVQISKLFTAPCKRNQMTYVVFHGDEASEPVIDIKNVAIMGHSNRTKIEILAGERFLSF